MSSSIPPDIFPATLLTGSRSRYFSARISAATRAGISTAPPRKSLTGIKILGTGIATGSNQVLNSDLESLGCDSDWILQRTGIESRYHTTEDEAVSDLCIRAAKQCLKVANVDPSMVDLIVVGTMTPDHAAPSTACLVQAELGCAAMAMDLNAACSGFVYSLITASQFVANGSTRCALVIGADVISMLTDPQDVRTYPLFGDGAGAVLLTADASSSESNPTGILDFHLAAEGKLGKSLLIPAGGSRMPLSQEVLDNRMQYLQMDGKPVFKWAVRIIPAAVNRSLQQAGLTLDDVDLLIPHQANIRIIDAAVESLGIEREKVFCNVDRYGNTSAASVPIALHEAVQQGRVKRGSNVLMVGFGAGLTWGSCLFRW